jgi:hypothetical protein
VKNFTSSVKIKETAQGYCVFNGYEILELTDNSNVAA